MKNKIFVLIAIFFTFFSFETVHADTGVLSFSDAPTIADYKRIRGVKNLQFVLFELARVYVGAPAVNSWDELESRGKKNTEGLTSETIAEFISSANLSVAFTKFSYNLIMKSLEADYSVVDKNYFDSSGYYKPLNGASIQANKGFVIDIANLFGARVVYLTAMPVSGGAHIDSNNDLWINDIHFVVRSKSFSDYIPTVAYSGSSSSYGLGSLSVRDSSSTSVSYGLKGSGTTKDISFLRVSQVYDEVSFPLRVLASLNISVDVGSLSKAVSGTGVVAKEAEEDTTLTFDENKVLSQVGDKVDGESLEKVISSIPGTDTGTDSDENIGSSTGIVGAIDKILAWLKEFFVPDFEGIQQTFKDFISKLQQKFDFIFKLIDYVKSLFTSPKRLYDFSISLNGVEIYPFPEKVYSPYFPTLRMINNVFLFLFTCLTIYKRFVGDGDVIAT